MNRIETAYSDIDIRVYLMFFNESALNDFGFELPVYTGKLHNF